MQQQTVNLETDATTLDQHSIPPVARWRPNLEQAATTRNRGRCCGTRKQKQVIYLSGACARAPAEPKKSSNGKVMSDKDEDLRDLRLTDQP